VPGAAVIVRVRTTPLLPRLSEAERTAHRAFVATMGEKAIWNEYLPPKAPETPAPTAAQA
jgi:DNA polymerase-3 subunit epsilon